MNNNDWIASILQADDVAAALKPVQEAPQTERDLSTKDSILEKAGRAAAEGGMSLVLDDLALSGWLKSALLELGFDVRKEGEGEVEISWEYASGLGGEDGTAAFFHKIAAKFRDRVDLAVRTTIFAISRKVQEGSAGHGSRRLVGVPPEVRFLAAPFNAYVHALTLAGFKVEFSKAEVGYSTPSRVEITIP